MSWNSGLFRVKSGQVPGKPGQLAAVTLADILSSHPLPDATHQWSTPIDTSDDVCGPTNCQQMCTSQESQQPPVAGEQGKEAQKLVK